jgi:hypothetical protein
MKLQKLNVMHEVFPTTYSKEREFSEEKAKTVSTKENMKMIFELIGTLDAAQLAVVREMCWHASWALQKKAKDQFEESLRQGTQKWK